MCLASIFGPLVSSCFLLSSSSLNIPFTSFQMTLRRIITRIKFMRGNVLCLLALSLDLNSLRPLRKPVSFQLALCFSSLSRTLLSQSAFSSRLTSSTEWELCMLLLQNKISSTYSGPAFDLQGSSGEMCLLIPKIFWEFSCYSLAFEWAGVAGVG